MTEPSPGDRTPEEQVHYEIDERARIRMMGEIMRVIQETHNQTTIELADAGLVHMPIPYEYLVAVVGHQMYCIECGADPQDMKGGDPEIAYALIRNRQNIAKHYWGADIEPYPY